MRTFAGRELARGPRRPALLARIGGRGALRLGPFDKALIKFSRVRIRLPVGRRGRALGTLLVERAAWNVFVLRALRSRRRFGAEIFTEAAAGIVGRLRARLAEWRLKRAAFPCAGHFAWF